MYNDSSQNVGNSKINCSFCRATMGIVIWLGHSPQTMATMATVRSWGNGPVVLFAAEICPENMMNQWIGIFRHTNQKMVIEKRIRNIAGTYHQQCRGFCVFVLIDGFLLRILILCWSKNWILQNLVVYFVFFLQKLSFFEVRPRFSDTRIVCVSATFWVVWVPLQVLPQPERAQW